MAAVVAAVRTSRNWLVDQEADRIVVMAMRQQQKEQLPDRSLVLCCTEMWAAVLSDVEMALVVEVVPRSPVRTEPSTRPVTAVKELRLMFSEREHLLCMALVVVVPVHTVTSCRRHRWLQESVELMVETA
jgi:hypothetical protein